MRDRPGTDAWLDGQLERLAIESGARRVEGPEALSRQVLERCGHFESFPGLAIASSGSDWFHPPATCFHVYATLEGSRLQEPQLVTLVAGCARNEAGGDEPGRLRRFRMREIVFVGPPAWVSDSRSDWMRRATAFAESLDLEGRLEAATDTFFGDPGRGRRLIQQVKALKYELRMNAGSAGPLAVASFNLHESFFTSRFDIQMEDGSAAASGCAAFGIERWVLAFLARHHACL